MFELECTVISFLSQVFHLITQHWQSFKGHHILQEQITQRKVIWWTCWVSQLDWDHKVLSTCLPPVNFLTHLYIMVSLTCPLVTFFPTLGTSYMFSRAWHGLHVSLCLALVTCFPVLGTGYMFSRAWHWLHVFPTLGTSYMFSRAWHWLHVSLCLALVTCFPALGTGYMFSRAWH